MAPPYGIDNPPMPLGYLASYLKNQGLGYQIFDLSLELFNRSKSDKKALWNVENDYIWRNTPPGEMISQLDGFEELVGRIIDSDSTIVGFSLVDPNQFVSCDVIKRVKKICLGKIIVVGGPVCATLEERIWLRDNTDGLIDFIVVGEGEKPLTELIKRLNTSPTKEEIRLPGVVDCRYSQSMIPYSNNPPLDLKEISFPDYQGFPLDSYRSHVAALMWSRGCISNCAFCKEKSLWDKHRTRPFENILEEIKFYNEKNVSEFVVYDSLVNGKPKYLEALCDAIIAQKLDIRWSALAIPDKSLTKGLLEKMKLAGCFVLIFGLESGSEKILKRMRKRFFLKDAIETIKNTKNAGIETAINIITGFPGEGEDDFKKTLDFLERYHRYIDRLDAVTPLQLVRGTYLFNHHDKFNIRLPEERAHEYWSTEDGMNTYKIRMQRRQEIIKICNQHGIGIRKTFSEEIGITAKKPKTTENIQHGLDILFLNSAYDEILDYDTASILEYLNQHNISAAYLNKNNMDSDENWLMKLDNFNAKFLAVKASSAQHANTLAIVEKLREATKSSRIILWGPDFRTEGQRKELSLNLVDGIIFQEYEKAFKKLIFRSKNDPLNPCIPGIYVPGQPFISLPPTRNLSEHPFPRYKEVDLNALDIDALPLRLSRGCPHRCSFCSIYYEEGPYRTREAVIVYEEICYHLEKNGISEYVFQDRAINGNRDTLNKLCDIMTSNRSPVTWKGKYVVKKGEDDFPFRVMAAAGCAHLNFGFISGSDNVLQLMGKPFDVNSIASALCKAHEFGIRTSVRLMAGYPGEEESDFWRTVSFLFDYQKYIDEVDSISPCHLQPGCDLEKDHEKYGIILPRTNWWREWHDGAYNNFSYRLKKSKEIAIVLKELEMISTLPEYVKEDAEILKKRDQIVARYKLCSTNSFRERPSKKLNAQYFVFPSDPVTKGILSDNKTFAGPETLEIDLTNNCNLSCIGCWCHSSLLEDHKFSGEKKRKYLPKKTVLTLLKDVRRIGGDTTVQLAGAGEPFLHPHIWEIIETVKKHGMDCRIITNFTLIEHEDIRRLVDLGVDSITASVWAGDRKTYRRTHPATPATMFDQLKNNLSFLTKTRGAGNPPDLKLYHVISSENADDIKCMIDIGLEIGADAVEFQMVDVVPGKTDILLPDQATRKRLLSQFGGIRNGRGYTEEFVGTEHLRHLNDPILIDELKEFGRVHPKLPAGFSYKANNRVVRCPNGKESVERHISSTGHFSCTFVFDQRACQRCPQKEPCWTNTTQSGSLCVHFLEILGAGSFIRRLTSSKREIQEYEHKIIDRVPCTVGWTYARITVDGHVIPCCKASDFSLGNLHEDSFSRIWQSPVYSEFRQKAKALSKKDPYFNKISCYRSCDNLGMNLHTHLKLLNCLGKGQGRMSS